MIGDKGQMTFLPVDTVGHMVLRPLALPPNRITIDFCTYEHGNILMIEGLYILSVSFSRAQLYMYI